ncbi:hypothetical protein WJR50_16695 [Catalinimonas sp. 4WD22]|uniref:hypothetical protein n=1 Tax=Catalinimonas locisalis TaxID=3133978 RepID=UPI0031017FD5
MLKETKMVLEIKKLVLELDEKLNTYADSSHISIRKQDTDYYENKVLNNTEENTDAAVYYNKIKCSISGSIFFFLITTTAIISAEYSMMVFEDYVAGFARDLAVCIASGFAATFIPWGSDWYYFIYGFTLPIQIATIIAILA